MNMRLVHSIFGLGLSYGVADSVGTAGLVDRRKQITNR